MAGPATRQGPCDATRAPRIVCVGEMDAVALRCGKGGGRPNPTTAARHGCDEIHAFPLIYPKRRRHHKLQCFCNVPCKLPHYAVGVFPRALARRPLDVPVVLCFCCAVAALPCRCRVCAASCPILVVSLLWSCLSLPCLCRVCAVPALCFCRVLPCSCRVCGCGLAC